MREFKFKIGEVVRVKKDLKGGNTYGAERFYEDMREDKVTIKDIGIVDGIYLVEENHWFYSEEMLEKVYE